MLTKKELTDKLVNQTMTAIDNDDLTIDEIVDSMAIYIVRNIDITFKEAVCMAKHIVSTTEAIKHQ